MSSVSKFFVKTIGPGLRASFQHGCLYSRSSSYWCSMVQQKNAQSILSTKRNVTTSAALFDETPIKMPSLSPTMSAGTIVKWHKKEGDKLQPGDVLCEVQTDKAVMAFEYDDEGILAKILINENSSEIPVGQLIAIVCDEGDDWKNVKVPENVDSSLPSSTTSTTSDPTPKDDQKLTVKQEINKISPSARNLLHLYGIDAQKLNPTGQRGTLLKEDVLQFVNDQKLLPKSLDGLLKESGSKSIPTPADATGKSKSFYVDIELTNMRRTIAKRLTESKSNTPHSYMMIKCFMDDVLQLRSDLKAKSITVSVNDLIVKSVALALKQVPQMNCQWDNENNVAKLLSEVDISIAVATPTGLITPIIRNANSLTLAEINYISRQLITRAKDGKLKPEEFIGGSFSISNLGMYDIDYFTGVINPPQAGILAVGATKKVFVGKPDKYQLRSSMNIQLSYDTRAIDEETVGEFLEKIRQNLEHPRILVVSDGTSRRRLSSLLQ